MRRRKLLISIGALGAGGTAAFGTEAFTSVEAKRSVDVEIAGDSSAFLAIEPISGNNADQYVSTENDDGTVALDLDDGAGTQGSGVGSGVNQDAVTQIEDLFKIINQGTQEVSVFFQDKSKEDAVTFRVTESNETTQGDNGDPLEGVDNSVDLSTGQQVVVGIKVDTLNNDVSGTLVDDVTIRAEAGATGEVTNPSEGRLVAEAGDLVGQPAFTSIQDAIDGNNPQNGAAGEKIDTGGTILVKNGTFDESVTIDVESLTLEAAEGANSTTIAPVDGEIAADIDAADVTIDGLALEATDARVIRNEGGTSGDLTVRNADLTLEADSTTGEESAIKMEGKDGDPGVGVLEVTNTDFTAINSDTSKGSLIGVKILEDSAEGSEFTDLTFTGDFASGITTTAVDSVTVTNTTFKDIDADDSPFASGAPISIVGERGVANTINDWTIKNNQFDNVSMPVGGGIYASPSSGTIDITASQNNFDVSTAIVTFGFAEDSEISIDATDNWWGDASGPSGGVEDPDTSATANGSGAEISISYDGTVAFDPSAGEPFEDAGANE